MQKKNMNLETKKNIICKSHYLAAIFLIALVTSAIYLTGDENRDILQKQSSQQKQSNFSINGEIETRNKEGLNAISECNLFSGKWVFDNKSYPLYDENRCSFMLDDYACRKYGRTDLKYQQWRWQPNECNLPRFNGTALLEKIRGKRVVFVGDSLNKNQWTSMLCMIESSLNRSSNKLVIRKGNSYVFEANHARHWNEADILIFDSFMWWLDATMTILWGSFGSSDAIYKRVEMKMRRYEMALNTWSDWLEININQTKTNLFFMSLSPYHFHGERWEAEENCYNETEPIMKKDYWGIATDREMMDIAEWNVRKLEKRGLKIEYLNITHLSDYRRDAHPSVYRKFFHSLSEEQLANPKSYSDCVHWCLPGVPDIWNEILFSYIINSS
ncbi:hypothetical protein CASFOL_037775 [Castilleja foliolosa]|uniref:Trichome birefringence-like N-terminal domain-containing protein n=1 Tax=Castilleja foliolosa TaxID=1961234 RepID=A0ABD3BJS2_9LAMI